MALQVSIPARGAVATYLKIAVMQTNFITGKSYVLANLYTTADYRTEAPGDPLTALGFDLKATDRPGAYAELKKLPQFDNAVDLI